MGMGMEEGNREGSGKQNNTSWPDLAQLKMLSCHRAQAERSPSPRLFAGEKKYIFLISDCIIFAR